MAQILHENGDCPSSASLFKGLPALGSLIPPESSEKEKASLILRLLRQAAIESRASRSQPFYSIRAVAAHFSVPPTTVTRLYGRLKEEGVLGTIWGSKTVVEPTQINEEIRIKAIVGLPALLQAFATNRNYRMFFASMQDTLWRCGFGTRLLFYEDNAMEPSNICDTFVDYKVDFVVWLAPNLKIISNAIRRLSDHDIRPITIVEGLPINGESGYYLSRRAALKEGLATWRRRGIRSVRLITCSNSVISNRQRMIEECLLDVGMAFSSEHADSQIGESDVVNRQREHPGIILASSDIAFRFVSNSVHDPRKHISKDRIVLIDGPLKIPGFPNISSHFDTIEFDWRPITRRITTNLASGRYGVQQERIIFQASWHSGAEGKNLHYMP